MSLLHKQGSLNTDLTRLQQKPVFFVYESKISLFSLKLKFINITCEYVGEVLRFLIFDANILNIIYVVASSQILTKNEIDIRQHMSTYFAVNILHKQRASQNPYSSICQELITVYITLVTVSLVSKPANIEFRKESIHSR